MIESVESFVGKQASKKLKGNQLSITGVMKKVQVLLTAQHARRGYEALNEVVNIGWLDIFRVFLIRTFWYGPNSLRIFHIFNLEILNKISLI